MPNIDIGVKTSGAKKAKEEIYAIGNEVEKALASVNKLQANSGFSKLAVNADELSGKLITMRKSFKDMAVLMGAASDAGFDKLTVEVKSLILLEKQLNSEIEKQAALQAKIASEAASGSSSARALAEQIRLQKKKTEALDEQARAFGIITTKSKELAAQEKKAQTAQSDYWLKKIKEIEKAQAAQEKFIKDQKKIGQQAQSDYWMKQRKEIEKANKENASYWLDHIKRVKNARSDAQSASSSYWLQHIKNIEKANRENAEYWNAHRRRAKNATKSSGSSGSGSLLKSAGIAGGVAGGVAAGVALVTQAISALIQKMQELTRAGVESFFTINTEVERTKILLSTALGGEDAGNAMFGDLLEMAGKMPFSVDSIAKSFVKLETAGIQDATRWVEGLTDAISAFGGTDEDLHLATIAIQQMAGKGVVSMEELRRQLGERVPDVIQKFAKEMGQDYKDLVKQISSGNLYFDQNTQEAMLRALETHTGAAEKLMDSMAGSLAVVKTAWTGLMVQVGESNDVWANMQDLVRKTADNLKAFGESERGKELIDSLTSAMNRFIKVVGDPAFLAAIAEGVRAIGVFLLDMLTGVAKAAVLVIELISKIKIPDMSAAMDMHDVSDPYKETKQDKPEDPNKSFAGLIETLRSVKGKVEEVQKKAGEGVELKLKPESGQPQSIPDELDSMMGSLDDRAFELRLNLATDEDRNQMILSEVDKLKEAAAAAGDGSLEGYTKQVELLEKSKSLLDSMKTEGRQVSKDEVAAAKKRWEYQQRITRGGKSAYGSAAKAYSDAYKEYMKLKKAEESGEKVVDDEAVNKQKELYDDLYRLELEGIEKIKAAKAAAAKEQEGLTDGTNTALTDQDDIVQLLDGSYKNLKAIAIDAQTSATEAAREATIALRAQELQAAKTAAAISTISLDASSDRRSLDGRAAGGPVTSNTPYMVGEEGPEVFVPRVSGAIIPNDKLGSGSTDQTPINLHFGNNEPITVMGNKTTLSQIQKAQEEQARFAA